VWTITSGIEALSAHIVLADGSESETSSRVLETITAKLKAKFGIDHTTIQLEHSSRQEKEMQH
jgi:cobalt-zinc-cadmium efflux system protein